MVRYNLDNLLGWQFRNHVANHWSALAVAVAKWRELTYTPQSSVETILSVLLLTAAASEGLNGKKAALLRGIISDQIACAHIDAMRGSSPKPCRSDMHASPRIAI